MRAKGPFVVCDLSAIAPTLIESELFGHRKGAFTNADRDRQGAFVLAHGGSIFLDEIGELESNVQPRLLRALERRQVKPVGGETYQAVDTRVIAATHRNLEDDIGNGRFRNDLFHRLNIITLKLPPLRERREDIPLLANHFLFVAASNRGVEVPMLSEDAVNALVEAAWPGNVRQLHNLMERVISMHPGASLIRADDLGLPPVTARSRKYHAPSSGTRSLVPFKDAKDRLLDSWEGHYLEDLLVVADGNLTDAAKRAGIARAHLHRLMRKHGVSR
jgi:two-component system nitrogen regulation response regulator GlnG